MTDYALQISVKRNGVDLSITSAEFSRSYGQGTISWEIVTPIPLDDIDTSTDTYSLSLSVAGKTWYRFEDCVATDVDLDESDTDGGTTISGTRDLYNADLLYYCAPKTIVFVNQEWLNKTFGDWTTVDGVLRYKHPRITGGRLLHSRLPGKEFDSSMLDFHVGQWTHHGIAKYLANLLGFDIVVTTPDMPIVDTFTIASGTAWFDAIKTNFTMWGANVQIMPAAGTGRPVIYVLDVINSSGGITPVGTITVDPESIDSISHTAADSGDSSSIIEHCIVIGRSGPENIEIDHPDLTPRRIPKFDWSPNCTLVNEAKTGDILSKRDKPDYSGSFGTGDDAFTVTPVQTIRSTQQRYRGADATKGSQDVLLKETVDTIDNAGQVVHRVQTEHFYSQDFQPVGSVEREHIYTNLPGSRWSALTEAKVKTTDQEYYVAGLKLAMTTEMVQEQVIYDQVKSGSTTYRDNPNPLQGIKRIDRTRTFVDKSNKTNQYVMWMTTHFSRTFIDRSSDGTLLKRKIDYDVLTGTAKMDSQILQNPSPEENKSTGDPFRREYFDGTPVTIGGYSCRRKSTTISHQDISSDDIAEALRDRAFYRRSADIRSMTVKTSLPIPIGTIPVKVIVNELPREVNSTEDSGTEELRYPTSSSSGGSGDQEYFLKTVTEKFSMSNASDTSSSSVDIEQTLELTTSL